MECSKHGLVANSLHPLVPVIQCEVAGYLDGSLKVFYLRMDVASMFEAVRVFKIHGTLSKMVAMLQLELRTAWE